MLDRGGDFSFFRDIHIRVGERVDIYNSIRPMITKFGSGTNKKAGTSEVITLKSRAFENLL